MPFLNRFLTPSRNSALAVLCLCLIGCSRQPQRNDPAPQLTYAVRGIVRGAPDAAGKSVSIEHEDIPGFMPAMTMPFYFRDAKEVEGLQEGDAVAFKLIVTDQDSWISGVKRIAAAEVKLPEATRPAPVPGKVARLREGDRLPEFALVDQAGRAISRETFAGKPLLLTFIFTRCPIPNFCPLMSQNFRTIHQAIGEDAALRGQVHLLSISIDPAFDTPAVLAEYGAKYTADLETWRFATGQPEDVRKLTQAFAVRVEEEAATINHSLATALIGPDGVIRNLWRGNGWKTDEVLAALRGKPPESPAE